MLPYECLFHSFNNICYLLCCKHCAVGMRRWNDIKRVFDGRFHLISSRYPYYVLYVKPSGGVAKKASLPSGWSGEYKLVALGLI